MIRKYTKKKTKLGKDNVYKLHSQKPKEKIIIIIKLNLKTHILYYKLKSN